MKKPHKDTHMEKQEQVIPKISIPSEKIKDFCLNNHIEALALFGSVLTERFHKKSDVDVLVQFDPQHIPGLIHLAGLELELGEILGRHVDLRTPNDLSRYFRDDVITGAYRIYGNKRFHSN